MCGNSNFDLVLQDLGQLAYRKFEQINYDYQIN